MINDLTELKQFIDWCKSQKIRAVNINNIQFEFSELAFVSEELSETAIKGKPVDYSDNSTWGDLEKMTDAEREELEMWSAR